MSGDWVDYDINVGYYTDNWGSYVFPFTNKLPSGDTLASVNVKAYKSSGLDRTSTLSSYTNLSTSLIESSPVISSDGLNVSVKFQYPSSSHKGSYVTLVFEVTTASTAKHTFYHHHVVVQ